MEPVIDFLLPEEALHVPFTSRLRTGARGCDVFCDRDASGAIRECILFTTGGLLLPVLSTAGTDHAGLAALLHELRPAVHSIMGIGRCVGPAETLVPVVPSARIEYFLMTVDRAALRPGMPVEIRGLSVRRAGPADADALLPLQKGYELEEVMIDPSRFSEASCLRLLKTSLREEVVYLAEVNGVPVAKAATNARGYAVDQVGGVFTQPSWRGKGIGAVVVTALLKELLAEKTRACLFVKKRNRPAIALYDRLGFEPVTDYVISYYGL
jgi:predicted GNAT family acetyltransferase